MAEHTPLSAKMLQVQTVMQSKLRQSNSYGCLGLNAGNVLSGLTHPLCTEFARQTVAGLCLPANLSEIGKNLGRSRKKVHSPRGRLRRRLVPVDDPPRPVVVFRINVSELSA